MTGPTPKTSVTVVPDALTATASLILVSRIWVSMRRRPPGNSAASSQRAMATACDGLIRSRTLAAWAAVMSLEMPPGRTSQSTARSRQTTWVRVRPRSRWRLDHTLSTAAWSSGATSRRAQRCGGDRTGVAGVALVRRPARQRPDPGAKLGLHIQHPLAGRHQLLGQQVTQAAGAPGPPRSAPARPPPTPAAARPGRPTSAPATHPAAPRPRRSPPRYASPRAGQRRCVSLGGPGVQGRSRVSLPCMSGSVVAVFRARWARVAALCG